MKTLLLLMVLVVSQFIVPRPAHAANLGGWLFGVGAGIGRWIDRLVPPGPAPAVQQSTGVRQINPLRIGPFKIKGADGKVLWILSTSVLS